MKKIRIKASVYQRTKLTLASNHTKIQVDPE